MIFTAYADGWMELPGRLTRCALGPAGVIPAGAKREGDGATPAGLWPLRRVLWRPDRGPAPATRLPHAPLEADDGWCDAPKDPAYNQPVRLPYPASAEHLWRDDRVYDLIIVLGYNDDPVVPGAGSAIFLHLARADYEPTQGCVALAAGDLLHLLSLTRPGDALRVRPEARKA
ncbi:MAG TPA: L,D-transpeptidase family protein [Caulobacteraceae bacterium]|jgi:L,D-peptidoglycan transpeptidase YkuD (ErfK/YbiS/YcfS/YnhG family)|nr:L,D-transpeptidase family protein [Caulobacteraceae bacterium]